MAVSGRKPVPWRLCCEASGRELIIGEGSVDPEKILGEYGEAFSLLERLGIVPCLESLLPVELSWKLPLGSQVRLKLALLKRDGVVMLRPAGQRLDTSRLLACRSEEDECSK